MEASDDMVEDDVKPTFVSIRPGCGVYAKMEGVDSYGMFSIFHIYNLDFFFQYLLKFVKLNWFKVILDDIVTMFITQITILDWILGYPKINSISPKFISLEELAKELKSLVDILILVTQIWIVASPD